MRWRHLLLASRADGPDGGSQTHRPRIQGLLDKLFPLDCLASCSPKLRPANDEHLYQPNQNAYQVTIRCKETARKELAYVDDEKKAVNICYRRAINPNTLVGIVTDRIHLNQLHFGRARDYAYNINNCIALAQGVFTRAGKPVGAEGPFCLNPDAADRTKEGACPAALCGLELSIQYRVSLITEERYLILAVYHSEQCARTISFPPPLRPPSPDPPPQDDIDDDSEDSDYVAATVCAMPAWGIETTIQTRLRAVMYGPSYAKFWHLRTLLNWKLGVMIKHAFRAELWDADGVRNVSAPEILLPRNERVQRDEKSNTKRERNLRHRACGYDSDVIDGTIRGEHRQNQWIQPDLLAEEERSTVGVRAKKRALLGTTKIPSRRDSIEEDLFHRLAVWGTQSLLSARPRRKDREKVVVTAEAYDREESELDSWRFGPRRSRSFGHLVNGNRALKARFGWTGMVGEDALRVGLGGGWQTAAQFGRVLDTGRGYTRGFVPEGMHGYGYGSRNQTRTRPVYPTRVPAGFEGSEIASGQLQKWQISQYVQYQWHIFGPRSAKLAREVRPVRVFEDPRVTRTGFGPDPYTGTVFAGTGTALGRIWRDWALLVDLWPLRRRHPTSRPLIRGPGRGGSCGAAHASAKSPVDVSGLVAHRLHARLTWPSHTPSPQSPPRPHPQTSQNHGVRLASPTYRVLPVASPERIYLRKFLADRPRDVIERPILYTLGDGLGRPPPTHCECSYVFVHSVCAITHRAYHRQRARMLNHDARRPPPTVQRARAPLRRSASPAPPALRTHNARRRIKNSDVLALASGQKAMAFWLWYQGQSQARILACHGFWPGSDIYQAKAGPKSHGFWTPLDHCKSVNKIAKLQCNSTSNFYCRSHRGVRPGQTRLRHPNLAQIVTYLSSVAVRIRPKSHGSGQSQAKPRGWVKVPVLQGIGAAVRGIEGRWLCY
ncbi:hypothetical protein C8R47DRAFT_1198913 [Mycena vitilis]|nr:hypothetical protein C8R47DRAFT_1198913 [Mycena vitilis]